MAWLVQLQQDNSTTTSTMHDGGSPITSIDDHSKLYWAHPTLSLPITMELINPSFRPLWTLSAVIFSLYLRI